MEDSLLLGKSEPIRATRHWTLYFLSRKGKIRFQKFSRGKLQEPIKRTNTQGTEVLIWRSRAVHPTSQPDEKGVLDRTECSLITQGFFNSCPFTRLLSASAVMDVFFLSLSFSIKFSLVTGVVLKLANFRYRGNSN